MTILYWFDCWFIYVIGESEHWWISRNSVSMLPHQWDKKKEYLIFSCCLTKLSDWNFTGFLCRLMGCKCCTHSGELTYIFIYFLILNFLKCLVMLWFFKATPAGNMFHSICKGNKDKTVLKKKKKRKIRMSEYQRSRVIIPWNHDRFTYTDSSSITTQHSTT